LTFINKPTSWYICAMSRQQNAAPAPFLLLENVATATFLRRGEAPDAIIAAAHSCVRQQGYAATAVADICNKEKISKALFIRHVASKEALAVAGAEAWTERARTLSKTMSITALADPLDRMLAHIAMRLAQLTHGGAVIATYEPGGDVERGGAGPQSTSAREVERQRRMMAGEC
jgi:AcrR family transcriptional regulator